MRKAFDLRPLEFGDILSRSFALYVAYFPLFAGMFLLLVFVPSALFALGDFLFIPPAKAASSSRAAIDDAPRAFLSVFLFVFQVVLALALAGSGVYYLVSRVYLGAKTSLREAFSALGAHFGALLATGLIVLIALCVLVAVVVIPAITALSSTKASDIGSGIALSFLLAMVVGPLGLWLCARYGLVFCVVMLEDLGADEAFSRSAELVRGYYWRLIGLVMVMALCLFVLVLPTGVVDEIVAGKSREWQLVGELVSSAWTALVLPVFVIPSVIFYFDMRCRKEGFDLAVLAAMFGVDPNFVARLKASGRFSYDIPGYVPKGWDPSKAPPLVMPAMPAPGYAPAPQAAPIPSPPLPRRRTW